MNGELRSTRVTRKMEENIYRTTIEAVLNNLMCCMVRIHEGERNWEFAFRRNGFFRRLARSIKERQMFKLCN